MGRDLIPPDLKVPKGSNMCPFCRVRKVTARSLADHCLEEILDNVHYMCSRCGVSYRYQSRKKMRDNGHICWSMNCAFKISRKYYSVDAIKTLLAAQGIRPAIVDRAVLKTDFVVPGPHEKNLKHTCDPMKLKWQTVTRDSLAKSCLHVFVFQSRHFLHNGM